MKTTAQIRRQNLQSLRSQFRFQTELAEKLQKPPAQLHNWLSGIKSIGPRSARDIETALGQPVGWLDNDHQITPADLQALAEARKASTTTCETPLATEAEIIHLYRHLPAELQVTTAAMLRAIIKTAKSPSYSKSSDAEKLTT